MKIFKIISLFAVFCNAGFSTIYIESPMDLSEDTNPADYGAPPPTAAQEEQSMPTDVDTARVEEEETPEGPEEEFGVTPQW